MKLRLIIFSILSVLGLGLFSFPQTVVASPAFATLPSVCGGNPNASPECRACASIGDVDPRACDFNEDAESIFDSVVGVIIQTLIYIIGGVAVVAIVLGAGMYVLSQGEAANIKRAKDIILYAVVGLIVAIIAQTAVLFVIGRF